MLRQLSDQDASFLYVETADTPMHVGGVSLIDLPDGMTGLAFYEAYRRLILERLRHVPLLHRRLAPLPLDIDRPFWVEDEAFDIDHHVRHVTAPAPGGMRELEALVGLLHGTLLDRRRPLWEFYVVDGLASGQAAIYTKVHHAAMDGASSRALVETVYDPTPEGRVLPPAAPDDGSEHATFANLAEGVVKNWMRRRIEYTKYLPELARAAGNILLPDPKTLKVTPMAALPRAPHTPLNVAIGHDRAYAARTLPLSAVKKVAKATGTKVNDVVLAVCGGALRSFFAARGVLPAASMVAMVPISLHDASDGGAVNHNGIFPVSLATDVADPLERLAAVHRSSVEQRQRFETLKVLPLPDVPLPGAGIIGPRLVELYGYGKLAERLPLLGNLVISNVPGPIAPLYVAGARIATMFPCSIPFHGSALNITVQGYCDRLDFGFIACRRALPELAALADALVAAFAELHPGGQTHDHDPTHPRADAGTPNDGARREAVAPPRPAGDDREAEAPRHRHPNARRQPAQGHRGPDLRQ